MPPRYVDVFFYGSYINFTVLQEADIGARAYQVARLPNYKLVIAPLANLVPEEGFVSYGILTQLNPVELERLYREHAYKKLGGIYLPEAVLVYTDTRVMIPALTYIAHDMETAKPDPAYVARILGPARDYGFPPQYLAHIASHG